MLPVFLTYEASVPSLTWHDAVEALRKGHYLPKPEHGDVLVGPISGRLLNRVAHIEGLGFAIKGDSIFPGNSKKGLPTISGAVLLYNPDDGTVRAVIESRLITQYKTAADSVLGALCLARPESSRLLIVGAGVVASTLVDAYVSAFPGIETVSVWSRRPEQAEELVANLPNIRATVRAVRDLNQALRHADIVSSATMATQPIIFGHSVRSGTHVDLVGSYTPDMREADDDLIAKALVYVDFVETVIDNVGEFVQPIKSGLITRNHVKGDLYDLVPHGKSIRRSNDLITVFKNGGGAHLDLMMANYVFNATKAASGARAQ